MSEATPKTDLEVQTYWRYKAYDVATGNRHQGVITTKLKPDDDLVPKIALALIARGLQIFDIWKITRKEYNRCRLHGKQVPVLEPVNEPERDYWFWNWGILVCVIITIVCLVLPALLMHVLEVWRQVR